jgi:hypothetical protein
VGSPDGNIWLALEKEKTEEKRKPGVTARWEEKEPVALYHINFSTYQFINSSHLTHPPIHPNNV